MEGRDMRSMSLLARLRHADGPGAEAGLVRGKEWPLHANAAGEDCFRKFGGRPAEGSARTEQNEFDGAEIR